MIFAGYMGEFGWEITSFYPKIVGLSEAGKQIELHTFPTSYGLYADLPGVICEDNGFKYSASFEGRSATYPDIDLSKYDDVLIPHDNRTTLRRVVERRRCIREDILPATDVPRCVVVHSRKCSSHPKRSKRFRDWHPRYNEVFEVFARRGLHVYFIGDPDRSEAYPEYGTDVRGEGFDRQLSILKASVLCFGPSSGTQPLAQWCGVPVFTWGDNKARTFLISKLAPIWNPFGIATYHPWQRNPSRVNIVNKYMNERYKPTTQELVDGLEYTLDHMA
ncbi:MAG TPA: hypothetical protein ENH11_00075 [Candidatus Acetothermia bacterium]|nr:hypothetical protein [Candidatus Acetothermia bacterium]